MLHKAWNSKGEMLYCFPRSSIKFQGHTGQNITDFDPNWAFPDYRPVAAFKSLRFALFVVSCMLSTYHVSSRIVISIYSILIPMNKHKWKICSLWSKPGMELLSQLPSFRYFQFFSIVMTHLSWSSWPFLFNWAPLEFIEKIYKKISLFTMNMNIHSHWVIKNMGLIRQIWEVSSQLSCSDTCQIWMWLKNNIWGPDMKSRGPNIINRGPNIIISAPT